MIKTLSKYINKPKVYEQSTAKFWDDEYISSQMLEAHFDVDLDAATRKPECVEKIVAFIASLNKRSDVCLLDLGCGPGIYLEKFSLLGYHTTGIDLSKRSIDYAIESASDKDLDIKYMHMNYLELNENKAYDVITLIYYDYSVLSKEDRKTLLKKIYKALKPDGLFIFDVYTPNRYKDVDESSSWSFAEKGGFWREKPYLCLENHYIYDDHLHLDQMIIIDHKNQIDAYRIWDQAFTQESIEKELNQAGFRDIDIYGDLTGKAYEENSIEMGIICHKT